MPANGKKFNQPVMAPSASQLPVKKLASGGEIVDAAKGQWQPLYDNVFLAQAATTLGEPLMFFTRGFGNGGVGATRSYEDTNVQTPGKLPGGVTFEIQGFALHIDAESETDFRLYQRGLCSIYIGDSVYQRIPMNCLGGFGGVSGATPAASVFLNNGSFSTNDYYRLPKGKVGNKEYELPILSEQNFRVELTYRNIPAAVAATGGLRFWFFLIGDYTGLLDQS